jgi:uncharacterized protein YndB with AHSA1/START domain
MTDAEPTTLVITRIFDAPRDLVFRAFVDPDQMTQWFGPETYSVARDSIDVEAKVGGHMRFTMTNEADPDESAPVDATYEEIVPDELIVFVEQWDDAVGQPGGPADGRLRCRIELHDEPDGKTRLVLTHGPFSEELRDMTDDGWSSSFTKLDKLLAAA